MPTQLKNLQSLIFDDLAFEFYNRVETAKIELSNQGSTVIELKGDEIWPASPGFGGTAFRGSVADGFQSVTVPGTFAPWVSLQDPLPNGCAF